MTPFFAYICQVVACSGVFYLYYQVALKNARLHRWNRYFIMGSVAFSMLAPLIKIPVQLVKESGNKVSDYTGSFIELKTFVFQQDHISQNLPLSRIMILAYLAVCIIMAIIFVQNILSIQKLKKRGSGNTEPVGSWACITGDSIESPFSFMNTIFMPTGLQDQRVLQHELVHVKEKHSWDNIFMELVTALFWINPIFHFFKKELNMVHEFIADEKASASDVTAYAESILLYSMQAGRQPVASTFAYAPVTRRIHMLLKSHQMKNNTLRKMLIFPFAFLSFMAVAVSQDKPGEKDTTAEKTVVVVAYGSGNPDQEKPVKKKVDNPPVYPGGNRAMASFLTQHIRYPKEAAKDNVQGKVIVSFVINEDGTISRVKTLGNPIGSGLEEEAMRVVRKMPKWKPGSDKGEKVKVLYHLPIQFNLDTPKKTGDTK